MAKPGLQEQQLQAIRQEVQQQIREQFGDQIKDLERRVSHLEAQVQLEPSAVPFSSSPHCGDPTPHPPTCHTRASYSPLGLLCTTNTEDLAEPLPESMYNYCMQRIAVSAEPLCDPALLWWTVLFAMQSITMAAFCVINDVETIALGVTPRDERDHAVSTCMFSNSYILGAPSIQYCIGYVAITLLACIIRSDDRLTLAAAFPQHDCRRIQWITNFAWFWQAVYMPGCFALEAATMFARSTDALEVVMNALAVTFIMDIDNMLYRNLLSEEDKSKYQQRAGVHSEESVPDSSRCLWAIFALNMTVMMFLFTVHTVMFGRAELHGQLYLDTYMAVGCPFYIVSFGGRFLIQRICGKPTDEGRLLKGCCSSLPLSIAAGWLGAFIYMLSADLSAIRLLLPPFVYFDASEFLACPKA